MDKTPRNRQLRSTANTKPELQDGTPYEKTFFQSGSKYEKRKCRFEPVPLSELFPKSKTPFSSKKRNINDKGRPPLEPVPIRELFKNERNVTTSTRKSLFPRKLELNSARKSVAPSHSRITLSTIKKSVRKPLHPEFPKPITSVSRRLVNVPKSQTNDKKANAACRLLYTSISKPQKDNLESICKIVTRSATKRKSMLPKSVPAKKPKENRFSSKPVLKESSPLDESIGILGTLSDDLTNGPSTSSKEMSARKKKNETPAPKKNTKTPIRLKENSARKKNKTPDCNKEKPESIITRKTKTERIEKNETPTRKMGDSKSTTARKTRNSERINNLENVDPSPEKMLEKLPTDRKNLLLMESYLTKTLGLVRKMLKQNPETNKKQNADVEDEFEATNSDPLVEHSYCVVVPNMTLRSNHASNKKFEEVEIECEVEVEENPLNDSFVELEQKLNIVHKKQSLTPNFKKPLQNQPMTPQQRHPALREYLSLRNGCGLLNTPKNKKRLVMKSPLQTPRSKISSLVFEQLEHLYQNSPGN